MGHWVIKSKKINISYSKTLEYLFVEHKYWDGWASSKARMQDYCNQDPPLPTIDTWAIPVSINSRQILIILNL